MSTLKSEVLLQPQEIFASSTTQGATLGQLATTGDGRYYRYFLNGGVATVAGTVQQGPAQDATNLSPAGGLTPAAAAIGATSVTISSSTTNLVSILQGGYMSVAITPGQGYTYQVLDNTATSGATGMVVTLADPLQIALTTSSRVVFLKNPYANTVQGATTLTAAPVGVAVVATPIANYGWLQVRGPAACLVTGTLGSAGLAVGMLVGGTAGSLAPCIAGTNVLGYTMSICATTEYDMVYLTIS